MDLLNATSRAKYAVWTPQSDPTAERRNAERAKAEAEARKKARLARNADEIRASREATERRRQEESTKAKEPAQATAIIVHPLTQIKRIVAHHFNVKVIDLVSDRRTANVVKPRQIAVYLCKTCTRSSLPAIGRHFGGRDHTTILHAVRKYTRLRDTDPEVNALLLELEEQLFDIAKRAEEPLPEPEATVG